MTRNDDFDVEPTMTDDLGFVGEPFDPLAPHEPAVELVPAVARVPAAPRPVADDHAARLVRELRANVVAAHTSALRAQTGLQRRLLAPWATGTADVASGRFFEVVEGSARPVDHLDPAPTPAPVSTEAAFKPLARSGKRGLDAADLEALTHGDMARVFGPAYDQGECNPSVRLASSSGLLLAGVSELELRGGPGGRGRLRASTTALDGSPAGLADATAQAAEIFALYLGLHLCLADARFARGDGSSDRSLVELVGDASGAPLELVLEVTHVDLVPRPHLRVDAEFRSGGGVVARVLDVAVRLAEKPGAVLGPVRGGTAPEFLGRHNRFGEPVLLSEFHMAHFSRGDQGIALGPEFAHYTGRKATRLPTGGLLLVDRVVDIDGRRGELEGGATHRTEYDSPADSWYYADTANASMPNCVYMETSLQAALMIGYYLGATLSTPDAVVSLRNLGGSATVLREVDLRDKTIRQHSALLSTTLMPGASLQNFSYELAVDGEPFYRGETLFGYFSDQALANQTGLDAGRSVPTWLEEQNPKPATRTIDIAARRADPDAPLCSRDHLALLDDVQVVDRGGRYGQGYLHAVREIDPQDWFFQRHFQYDPVIPGSLGVESVIQAMQEWLLDSGLADGLTDPAFVLPAGSPFSWKYRGQFLPTDGESTLEVHVKEVRRSEGRVRVVGEASVWKPGLRIYELTDVAVELREEGAAPW